MTLAGLLAASGCDVFTDAATRLAFDLERSARQLSRDGERVVLRHEVPSRRGECEGPYKVQLDRQGALVFWCKDASGTVVASPGTSYHRRFVLTPMTYILEKPAGEALVIELEKRGSDIVVIGAR